MRNKDCINRYLYIVRYFKRGRKATFTEIQEHLDNISSITGEDFNISIRTFQRDVEAIREVFHIDIKYSRVERKYYINEDSKYEVLSERIIESLEIFHSLKMMENLNKAVDFNNRPSLGTEHLFCLISAIKKHNVISLVYNKNWDNIYTHRKVLPLILKEFKSRWYVVAKSIENNEIRTYSLDRIVQFKILPDREKPPQNIKSYFKNSFGIYGSMNDDSEEVILSFDTQNGKYIKSAPLHKSQMVMVDNDKELRVKLNISVSYDFIMELLSYGENVEVIAPKSLRKIMRDRLKAAANRYKRM
ncbi:MAG: WYL domain-containing protein [Bacteroidales bacterium]